MGHRIHCSILTPEKVVYEGEADAVYIAAYDGERGFLPGHAPMVVQLGIGMTRLYNGQHCALFEIEGGFAEFSKNRIIMLAEEAMKKEELSERHIRSELDDMHAMTRPADREEAKKYDISLKKLQSRLKIAVK